MESCHSASVQLHSTVAWSKSILGASVTLNGETFMFGVGSEVIKAEGEMFAHGHNIRTPSL